LWLIDRLGRKTLLYVGSVGYIVSLGLCAWAFYTEKFAIVPWCIFAFIAAHAVGQGAVIWVYIAEIFPDRFRASGHALRSSRPSVARPTGRSPRFWPPYFPGWSPPSHRPPSSPSLQE